MTAAATPNPIPDTYRRVTPCLIVQGAARAMDFYAEVFGATERMRFPGPDGSVAHAEIQIGDSVIIVEDESPYRGTKAPPSDGLPGTPCFQFIYVDQVGAMFTGLKGAISRINVFSPMARSTIAGRMTGQTGHTDGADLVRARSAGRALRNVGIGRAASATGRRRSWRDGHVIQAEVERRLRVYRSGRAAVLVD